MSAEQRIEQYLAEARKSDEMAAKAASSQARDQWLRIADNYRRLAKFAGSSCD